MKKGWWVAGLALLLVGNGKMGLPEGWELEERQLVTAVAVDHGEEVRVTALTGVRVTENEKAEVLSGKGESLAEACWKLKAESARTPYLGQTEQLLLGEGCDLGEVLELILTDGTFRMDTLLYIVRGEAGKGLAASTELAVREMGGKDSRRRTIGEILPRLAEGEKELVPALAAGEDGRLYPAGWAVLERENIVGYLEGNAARGAELLLEMAEGDVVNLPSGAVKITKVRSWAAGGTLRCEITARRMEGEGKEQELTAWGEMVLAAALSQGWDCWGLDKELGISQPRYWAMWENWKVENLRVAVTGKVVA